MWFNVGAVLINIVAGIYRTVARAYNLMLSFTVDTFSLTSNADLAAKVNGIINSIYTLIAVFMLFRITVTMIQYLIDPDKISDKSTGTGKLVSRIIISLTLVIAFPIIMDNVINPLQDALLQEGSILYRLFSVDDTKAASIECINNINSANSYLNGGTSGKTGIGELISGCEFDQTFYDSLKNKVRDIKNNKQLPKYECYLNKNKVNCSEYLDKNYYVTFGVGKTGAFTINLTDDQEEAKKFSDALDQGYSTSQINGGISESLSELLNSDGGKFAMDIASSFSTDPIEVTNTKFIADPSGVQKLATLVNENEIDYDTFISIICGIILVVIFLILCIEVVIRNLKLLVLQILAPIAFISYMNPNDKVLNNWFQKFIGCYLDLFLKILAIRMSIFFVSLISSTIGGGLEKILIYLGIFLFAKSVPNLISDIFGLKNMGGTFKDSMGALKTAAFTGAGAVGGTIGSVAALAGGSTLGQAAKVFGSGFSGKMGNVKKSYGTVMDTAKQRKASGISWTDAQKSEFPWHKSTKDVLDAKKSASDNYKNLDAALDGSVFASNKALGQLNNLWENGTIDEKVAHAADFGVNTSGNFKDNDGVFKKFDKLSTEAKLNVMDSAWGDRKNAERARVLVESSNAVASGNANDFQKNIVTLSQRLDLSEKNAGVEVSGISTAYKVTEDEKKRGITAESKAFAALKKAKEHNKSGYQKKSN